MVSPAGSCASIEAYKIKSRFAAVGAGVQNHKFPKASIVLSDGDIPIYTELALAHMCSAHVLFMHCVLLFSSSF